MKFPYETIETALELLDGRLLLNDSKEWALPGGHSFKIEQLRWLALWAVGLSNRVQVANAY